jgi:hypothetical protein
MLLRRGLLIAPTWAVDSDPERTAALVNATDVQVAVKNVQTRERQVWQFPARETVPILGVLVDRRPARDGAGAAFARRIVGVAS